MDSQICARNHSVLSPAFTSCSFVQLRSSTFVNRSLTKLPNFVPELHLPSRVPRAVVGNQTEKAKALQIPKFRRPLSVVTDFIRHELPVLEMSAKYGPVYTTDFLGNKMNIVADLEAIEEIFSNNKLFASSDGASRRSLELLFGTESLTMMDGQKHSESRAIVRPAFSPGLLPIYFIPMIESVHKFWNDISKMTKDRNSVELAPLLKDHYLRVIIQITTGITTTSDDKSMFIRLRDLYTEYEDGVFAPTFTSTWKKAYAAREEIVQIFDSIITSRLVESAETIEKLRANREDIVHTVRKRLKNQTIDILTVVLAHSKLKTGPGQVHDPANLKTVIDLLLTIWFGGHVTQAAPTLSAIMHICTDDSVRKTLSEEQEELMKSVGSREVKVDQIMRFMPLLDSYISEILRLYPPAPLITRRVTEDTIICGYLFKKGSAVTTDTWTAHRDPKHFNDPLKLQVDRFISKQNSPKTFPFGAPKGAHYCIGSLMARLSMVGTIAALLREYDLGLDPNQDTKISMFSTVQPVSGVKVDKCERKCIQNMA